MILIKIVFNCHIIRVAFKKPLIKLELRFAVIPVHLNFFYEAVFIRFTEVYFSVIKINMAFFSWNSILIVCHFLFLDAWTGQGYYCCFYRKYIEDNFLIKLYPDYILCSYWLLGLCKLVFCKNYFLYKKIKTGR